MSGGGQEALKSLTTPKSAEVDAAQVLEHLRPTPGETPTHAHGNFITLEEEFRQQQQFAHRETWICTECTHDAPQKKGFLYCIYFVGMPVYTPVVR